MICSDFIRKIRQIYIKGCLKSKYGCLFGKNVQILGKAKIEGYVDVQRDTKIVGGSIASGTNIGEGNAFVNCKIGKFCLFGDYNRNIFGHHPINTFVSMHSFFYQPQPHGYAKKVTVEHESLYKFADKEKKYYNIIGNDVYITNNVLILEGVKIGDGAVVTPGSVVTKNVPPYAIVRGNPAKVVAYRFEPDEIAFLKKLEWWNKSDEWLLDHVDDFSDIKKLMERVSQEEIIDGRED